MNEMIKVNCENVDCPTVSGRELHKALESWNALPQMDAENV